MAGRASSRGFRFLTSFHLSLQPVTRQLGTSTRFALSCPTFLRPEPSTPSRNSERVLGSFASGSLRWHVAEAIPCAAASPSVPHQSVQPCCFQSAATGIPSLGTPGRAPASTWQQLNGGDSCFSSCSVLLSPLQPTSEGESESREVCVEKGTGAEEDDPIIRGPPQSSARKKAESDKANSDAATEDAGNAASLASGKEPGGPNGEEEEVGGPRGPEPTRYGDWEKAGRCYDF